MESNGILFTLAKKNMIRAWTVKKKLAAGAEEDKAAVQPPPSMFEEVEIINGEKFYEASTDSIVHVVDACTDDGNFVFAIGVKNGTIVQILRYC
ncbi:hypothetical protein KSP40_PGU022831 [Platanthera guangdongensis]|uniref:Uncharacterized protein n=1 Tax=Platanthera guangdongensis TaxID=2320717 RepID=A0ABR2LNI9_9ASPA